MGTTIIAAVSFLVGAVFVQVWPLFVRWLDSRTPITTQIPPQKPIQLQGGMPITLKPGDPDLGIGTIPPIHRRVGLAEARRKAEMASMSGATHQAEVTANNTRAMS